MKRIVRVGKSRQNTLLPSPVGRAWTIACVLPAIMPDEMEKIVEVVRCLTRATLKWYCDNGSFTVAYLLHTSVGHQETVRDSKKLDEIRELFEWLKPVHQKARDALTKEKITLVA